MTDTQPGMKGHKHTNKRNPHSRSITRAGNTKIDQINKEKKRGLPVPSNPKLDSVIELTYLQR